MKQYVPVVEVRECTAPVRSQSSQSVTCAAAWLRDTFQQSLMAIASAAKEDTNNESLLGKMFLSYMCPRKDLLNMPCIRNVLLLALSSNHYENMPADAVLVNTWGLPFVMLCIASTQQQLPTCTPYCCSWTRLGSNTKSLRSKLPYIADSYHHESTTLSLRSLYS